MYPNQNNNVPNNAWPQQSQQYQTDQNFNNNYNNGNGQKYPDQGYPIQGQPIQNYPQQQPTQNYASSPQPVQYPQTNYQPPMVVGIPQVNLPYAALPTVQLDAVFTYVQEPTFRRNRWGNRQQYNAIYVQNLLASLLQMRAETPLNLNGINVINSSNVLNKNVLESNILLPLCNANPQIPVQTVRSSGLSRASAVLTQRIRKGAIGGLLLNLFWILIMVIVYSVFVQNSLNYYTYQDQNTIATLFAIQFIAWILHFILLIFSYVKSKVSLQKFLLIYKIIFMIYSIIAVIVCSNLSTYYYYDSVSPLLFVIGYLTVIVSLVDTGINQQIFHNLLKLGVLVGNINQEELAKGI